MPHETIKVGNVEVFVRTTNVATHAMFSEHPDKWAYLRLQLLAALQLIDDEIKDLK